MQSLFSSTVICLLYNFYNPVCYVTYNYPQGMSKVALYCIVLCCVVLRCIVLFCVFEGFKPEQFI